MTQYTQTWPRWEWRHKRARDLSQGAGLASGRVTGAPLAGPAPPTLLFSFSQGYRVWGSYLLGSHCSEFSPHQVFVVASLSRGGTGMLKDLLKAMELSGISRRETQVSWCKAFLLNKLGLDPAASGHCRSTASQCGCLLWAFSGLNYSLLGTQRIQQSHRNHSRE